MSEQITLERYTDYLVEELRLAPVVIRYRYERRVSAGGAGAQ